ncbi:unnamed protein product, partial [Brassica rapa subsp. trilocularis]
MCACSAASVNVVDGLKTADPSEKCPLCREVCVYKGAVHLDELSILLKRRYLNPVIHAAAESTGKKDVKQREQRGYSKPKSIGIINAEASLEYNNLIC